MCKGTKKSGTKKISAHKIAGYCSRCKFFEFFWPKKLHKKKKSGNFAPANTDNALWCNGSTSDSGSACEGSNPSKATTHAENQLLTSEWGKI